MKASSSHRTGKFCPNCRSLQLVRCFADTPTLRFAIHSRYYTKPRHDKTNKIAIRPTKTQIGLGIRPVWSEYLLSAWRKSGSLATHWAHSKDSDQTGRMPRLIWVFAWRTVTLLVLSCRGSNFLCALLFKKLNLQHRSPISTVKTYL